MNTSNENASSTSLPANGGSSSIDMGSDPASLLSSTTPNSKPREQQTRKLRTYVYQDFAHAEPSALNTGTCHERVPPQSLQSQKLPSKLGAMLCDPDLTSIITWMPHGRSWKVLNRELFSSFALPRYFGHTNHASFVRIVNAWGFRRITKGPDRDSYYHELFLRGMPRLHERMKRLPTCHRKTPVDKDDKCPDFYELAKTSPLPEVPLSYAVARGSAAAHMNPTNQVSSGYLGNPMAAATASHPLGGNAFLGDVHGAASSTSTIQGSDMPSLLKLLHQQQGPMQQQQQQHGSDSIIANNQSLVHQMLRMQNISNSSSTQTSSFGCASNTPGTLGQLANVATFGQSPPTISSSNNDTVLNSLTSMNQGMNGVPQRQLSNDKVSVNDVVQLRSIERTNELLAQKLALMEQNTMMMKQNTTSAPGDHQLPIKQESTVRGAPVLGTNTGTGGPTPSKEEMLLQMIRHEKKMNGAAWPSQDFKSG